MKKKNIISIMLVSALFLNSIFFYFFNNSKINANKLKIESLRIEFDSLKGENQTLTKTNYQLIETASSVSEKVNRFKSSPSELKY
ncbi:hypothetical protein KPL35_05055 [Clostridium sp. CF011]|uniref:hypothetical protein n=1 Tax=Clostridium TaxID=1485 RepID=UPI0013EE8308|nr:MULTISPECIES: hypothetical protein [Clostridium]MBU3091438.1 hypothetical protein [Clostridium sp. CF011]MBW9145170.1 hypothetical protein [Clostridium sp. CM027]MBZ9609440.1 hypothetical protein [Clostridium estertheticum]UVE40305.1 hypothetical protein KTC92_14405 [Clostridium sp. CM027]WAG69249.1 hypothetical protein LL036_14775 [Clostridium sp. CF011]